MDDAEQSPQRLKPHTKRSTHDMVETVPFRKARLAGAGNSETQKPVQIARLSTLARNDRLSESGGDEKKHNCPQ